MLDLSVLTTESQNMATTELDKMSAEEIVAVMNAEDRKIPDAVQQSLPSIAAAAALAADAIKNGGRLIYIGAGTSGRLGVLDAAECGPTFGVSDDQVMALMAGGDSAFIHAAEGAEDDTAAGVQDLLDIGLKKADFVIGIAASGRTPYVCAALEYAKRTGCHTAALTCNADTPMGAIAELPIEVIVGPEVLTGSTRLKAGTAQKMVLNMISTAAMVLCGKVYKNLMIDMLHTNEKLHMRARNIIVQATGVSEEHAGRVLREAGGDTKAAVTMLLAGVSAEKAQDLLHENHGYVRYAVSRQRGGTG